VAALIVASLSRDFDWSGAAPVFGAMCLVLLAFVAFPTAAQSKWARRHYLRHFAAYSAPAPPASPDAPTVAAC
jgi:hypothetical protein